MGERFCGKQHRLQRASFASPGRVMKVGEGADANSHRVRRHPSQALREPGTIIESSFKQDFSRLPLGAFEQDRLKGWLPYAHGYLGDTPVYYPSSLAKLYHVRALTDGSGVHLGVEARSISGTELDLLLAHESIHRMQQLQGIHRAERVDVELEAHALATEMLAGRSHRPQLHASVATPYFDTPHDKLVVERAKKRLELLEACVEEWETRRVRRLRSGIDRDHLLKKRSKMDVDLPEPPGQRERLEKENIERLNRLPLKIELTEDAVKFIVKFQVRFEEPAMKSRFGELVAGMREGIRMVWTQRLKGVVFGGRKYSIEPEFSLVSGRGKRDQNFWLVIVRENDSDTARYPGCAFPPTEGGVPTSVTDPMCDGGVMSVPPLHITKPDVLGHELLHLFGLVDRYIALLSRAPGKKAAAKTMPSRETEGRSDPLGGEKGTILSEDLGFLFDRLGVYAMEEGRGLDVLRKIEEAGMSIEAVRAEIYRQEEIVRLGRDPRSLIPIRKDFRREVLSSVEEL